MKKTVLSLLMIVLCLGLFVACDQNPTDTGGGSTGGSYEGWEVIDPIENGGDYTFND